MNSQLSQLEERLTKVLDRSPTVHELSEHSGFSVQDVLEAQQSWEARNHYESLDYGEEDEREDRRSLSEVVPDKRYQDSFVASRTRIGHSGAQIFGGPHETDHRVCLLL